MRFERFCSSRVVIVAGKGGVGKTTVTASFAVAAARAGSSVLIVEVEGKSGLTAAFGRPVLTYEQIELEDGIEARTLTPDEALVEYLDDHGMRRISRRMRSTGVLDLVATAVPGMKDILVLGKVKQLERADGGPDLILLDAPAAGHAIRFLTSPQGLLDAVRVGPISRQAAEVVEMLSDPARCRVVLVTLPEETPVTELVETAFALEDRAGVALGPVVVNGCWEPLPAGVPTRTQEIDDLARSAGQVLAPGLAGELAAAATFRQARVALQARQLERLRSALPLPQVRLPHLFTGELGRSDVDRLADALLAEVDRLADPRT
jgi:anion-transporting  ArsA/GET3 family ATPase